MKEGAAQARRVVAEGVGMERAVEEAVAAVAQPSVVVPIAVASVAAELLQVLTVVEGAAPAIAAVERERERIAVAAAAEEEAEEEETVVAAEAAAVAVAEAEAEVAEVEAEAEGAVEVAELEVSPGRFPTEYA